jgi:hypothetical protein
MTVESITQTTSKVCSKCTKTKPLDEFCKDSGYSDGRRSDCNGCRSLVRRGQNPQFRSENLGAMPKPPQVVPYNMTVPEQDLPAPNRLPAAYLKRCSDYWTALVGGEEPTARIA